MKNLKRSTHIGAIIITLILSVLLQGCSHAVCPTYSNAGNSKYQGVFNPVKYTGKPNSTHSITSQYYTVR